MPGMGVHCCREPVEQGGWGEVGTDRAGIAGRAGDVPGDEAGGLGRVRPQGAVAEIAVARGAEVFQGRTILMASGKQVGDSGQGASFSCFLQLRRRRAGERVPLATADFGDEHAHLVGIRAAELDQASRQDAGGQLEHCLAGVAQLRERALGCRPTFAPSAVEHVGEGADFMGDRAGPVGQEVLEPRCGAQALGGGAANAGSPGEIL